MIQNFYIKKGSELPSLIMGTTDYNYFKYSDFYTGLMNATITFSMKNIETGCLKINKSKKVSIIPIEKNCADCIEEQKGFYIKYDFSKKDTREAGIYIGEFTIDFTGSPLEPLYGEMILPIRNTLYINIIDNY